MPIVYPTKPIKIDPTLLIAYPATKRIGFNFPDAPNMISFPAWHGGVFSLVTDYNNYCIASCSISNFTNNCGIRAIQNINFNQYCAEEDRKVFLKGLESYIRACGYSVLIGSDGEQTGATSLKNIQRYGEGWQVTALGKNQRFISDNLSLYWKYLNKHDEYLPIEWHS